MNKVINNQVTNTSVNNEIQTRSRTRTTNGETGMHKHSKKVTIDFLNQGGKINVRCQYCKIIWELPSAFKYDTEISGRGIRWDIAGLDKNCAVICGIELKNTSSVTKIFERQSVQWVEVFVDDILSICDTNDKIWLLNDLQPCQICRDKIKPSTPFKIVSETSPITNSVPPTINSVPPTINSVLSITNSNLSDDQTTFRDSPIKIGKRRVKKEILNNSLEDENEELTIKTIRNNSSSKKVTKQLAKKEVLNNSLEDDEELTIETIRNESLIKLLGEGTFFCSNEGLENSILKSYNSGKRTIIFGHYKGDIVIDRETKVTRNLLGDFINYTNKDKVAKLVAKTLAIQISTVEEMVKLIKNQDEDNNPNNNSNNNNSNNNIPWTEEENEQLFQIFCNHCSDWLSTDVYNEFLSISSNKNRTYAEVSGQLRLLSETNDIWKKIKQLKLKYAEEEREEREKKYDKLFSDLLKNAPTENSRSGNPWFDDEENKLLSEYINNMKDLDISKVHGRTKVAIKARICKLRNTDENWKKEIEKKQKENQEKRDKDDEKWRKEIQELIRQEKELK